MKRLLDYFEEKFKKIEAQFKDLPPKKTKKEIVFKFVGNKYQHEFNEVIVEALEKVIELIEAGSKNRSTDLIKTQINKLTKRNKCIKMAGKSPGGWETVQEYLTDDLADDSADDRKIRQAEKTALGKLAARGKKV